MSSGYSSFAFSLPPTTCQCQRLRLRLWLCLLLPQSYYYGGHIKSRFLLDTEEIVRTAQAWRSERTRWFCTRKLRNFLRSSGAGRLSSPENFAIYGYKTSEFCEFSTPRCLQTSHVLVLYSIRKISEICNNNGCGLFMTPVEFPATSIIDPFLATTRTILPNCSSESAISLPRT